MTVIAVSFRTQCASLKFRSMVCKNHGENCYTWFV